MKNILLTRLLTGEKFLRKPIKNPKNQGGFTLLEVLVVAVMVGILSAIAAPSFLGFVNNQRTRTAQSRVSSSIREAQSLAKNKKVGYQVSFRTIGTLGNQQAQVVIHTTPTTPPLASLPPTQAYWDSLFWQNLESGVTLDASDINVEVGTTPTVFSSKFDYRGNYIGTTDKYIRLEPISGGPKYCVVVSTILGAVKTFNQGEASCI
jgi:prepilin-type N-terminal cleavage/methylation domain-containing protein